MSGGGVLGGKRRFKGSNCHGNRGGVGPLAGIHVAHFGHMGRGILTNHRAGKMVRVSGYFVCLFFLVFCEVRGEGGDILYFCLFGKISFFGRFCRTLALLFSFCFVFFVFVFWNSFGGRLDDIVVMVMTSWPMHLPIRGVDVVVIEIYFSQTDHKPPGFPKGTLMKKFFFKISS